MFPVLPCTVKHHGSVKYLKYFITISRLKGSKSRPNSAKILAAPLSPATKSNYNEENTTVKDSFGKNNSHYLNPILKKASLEENVTTEINPHLKIVSQPDVTATVPDVSETNTVNIENDKIRLLNTVKPSDLDWHKQVININVLPKYYKSLSKFRLTGLVVLTTLAGYGMSPGVFEPISFLCMVTGTALTSAAANTVNQVLEVPYDSQMNRTKRRVLIRGLLTPLHASTFAACCAGIGLATLYFGANPLTAALGATNLVLYTSIYTPMKRYSIANTWVGSVVGAIPPLMGWAACTGSLSAVAKIMLYIIELLVAGIAHSTDTSLLYDSYFKFVGAILMGAILYSWQFPHFNSLSWALRPDYSRAGYYMTSVVDPALCRRVALRHSIALVAICSCAPLLDLTTWAFAFDSFPLNCYLVYRSWKFYKEGDNQNSRKLFRFTLVHLPALMFLLIIGKKYSSKNDKHEVVS
ncbi:protoheme IX farnesyltransferase, mitochondrial [Caerostris extrusa]|uniref:Protoheme IX farnesyltransferase, mitochondrial n=1 Tax=Caerostris extrusa TaxID=172846 RepID=A0AAV4Q752_CAEEX|nr:protoheme IX farnesyltransferase, mitochondrial [Caerostris extrusa]